MRTIIAAAAVSVLVASASAGAFTYDNRTNQNPDVQAQLRGANGLPVQQKNSHFSMQFSGSGLGNNQASGVQGRFVPSSNPDFQTPYSGPNNLDLALGNRH